MAEHNYDEVQEIELDYTGYTRPFNRSNQTPNEQQKKSLVKITTAKPGKRCVFLWIGIFIGSIVSGVTVFLVVKYGEVLSYNVSSCFWTDWTSWTPCKLPYMIGEQYCIQIGKQTRSQVFTGYTKSCVHQDRFETKSCYDRTLDIRFDPTTLHSKRFLSDDHTILSNQQKVRTPNNPNAKCRFQNYGGVMVTMCVEKLTNIYYEIYFQYVITYNLKSNWLVLELGIGEPNKIDNSHYVGNSNVSGWSFQLMNSEYYNKVCLFADHQPHGEIKNIKQLSNNTAGTQVNGTFGILIDRVKNKLSFIYNDTVLYTFQDVLSNEPLCPVFGVYNPHKVQVDLQIVSVANMTYAP